MLDAALDEFGVADRVADTELGSESVRIAAGIRAMLAAVDVVDTMDVAVDYVMRMLPSVSSASVTLVAGEYASTPAYRGDVALALDKAQYELDQGPCLDAATETEFVHSPNLHREYRWPQWTTLAIEAGVRSVACYRLFSDNDRIGALNLYATQPNAFPGGCLDLGLRLSAQVSSALTSKIHDDAKDRALTSRSEIGQAQGILMERLGLTADQAFETLSQMSQHQNRKLRDIAADLARTGELPDAKR
jgi:GAF domain-containing protein